MWRRTWRPRWVGDEASHITSARRRGEGKGHSIPLRRARPVHHPPTPARKLADRIHFRGIKLEIEDRHVFDKALAPCRARYDDGAFLDEKPQAHLPARPAVALADRAQRRIVPGAASRDRTVRRDRQAVAAGGGDHLRLVEKGMP